MLLPAEGRNGLPEPLRSPDSPTEPLKPADLTFRDRTIRKVIVDGAVWLVAADVCRALDLPIDRRITSAKYLRGIDASHKAYSRLPTSYGMQRFALITVEGARLLSKRRDRRVDREFRGFLSRSDHSAVH